MQSQPGDEYAVTTEFTNARDVPCAFVLEPYGGVYELPCASTLRIVIQGPSDGSLHIEYSDDAIILYTWSGSTTTLTLDGELLFDGRKIPPVPPTPKGSSVRDFVQMMFGKHEA